MNGMAVGASIIPNIPRVFTGIAEWGACLLYIYRYRRRVTLNGWKLVLVLAVALVLQCGFLEMTGTLPLVYWFPCMGVAAAMMMSLIWICCDMDWANTVYVTARAFLLAELVASLEWQIYYYMAEEFDLWRTRADLAFLLPLYALFFIAMYMLEDLREEPRVPIPIRPKELWIPLAITLASFAISNLSFVLSDTPFTTAVIGDIHTIRTLVDLAGVAALYAYHIQRSETAARRELDSIQNILQSQYAQYQQSKDSIDAINRKYHDLKHQIAVLRAEQDPERRSAYLDGMEQEIRDYESQNKTGNPVLDTVLTGKSLYCARCGIELTCVADGSLLQFMDVMDICTIFGNMLDNAIECQLRMTQKEKRLVHLEVYARRNFLIIHCENYCEETPDFQDGLPLTTKDDPVYHGYGLKSIRYAVEKYGGSMTVVNENNWFSLNIVIPLKEEHQPA